MVRVILELQEWLESHNIHPGNVVLKLEVESYRIEAQLVKALRADTATHHGVHHPQGRADMVILGMPIIIEARNKEQ